jgi:ribonuclease BN (tRNA processing enzyme)
MPEWIVLGAGSILPRPGFGCSGHALAREGRKLVLFDCGPGTLRSLGELGYTVEDIGAVVLTHFHPDHCWDLFALAFARRNPGSKAGHLELVGPEGLADLLERAGAVFGSHAWVRFEDVTVREVESRAIGRWIELDGLKLAWRATGHTPHALAWRVELGKGLSVTYSGDSGESAELAALARGTSLLVCECSFPEELAQPQHLTPSGAARLALDAGAARLVLTHFYPGLEPELAQERARLVFPGAIEVSHDRSRHALTT